MTRAELQQAIKALRELGVLHTPALNSKTVVLQEWLDTHNRQQTLLDEATSLFDEIQPVETPDLENCDDLINRACSLICEIDQNPLWDGRHCIIQTPEIDLITADEILTPDYAYCETEHLEIGGLPIKVQCYEYGYKPFIAWNGSDYEAIEYDIIPGSLSRLKTQLIEMIDVLTTSDNFITQEVLLSEVNSIKFPEIIEVPDIDKKYIFRRQSAYKNTYFNGGIDFVVVYKSGTYEYHYYENSDFYFGEDEDIEDSELEVIHL